MLCYSCKNVERAMSTFANVAKMKYRKFHEKCLDTIVIYILQHCLQTFNVYLKMKSILLKIILLSFVKS